MNASIGSVNYSEIFKKAQEMRIKGEEINRMMKNVYAEISNLKKSWSGERYNKLVELFNNLSTDVNKILTLVVGKIPNTLETIANNYSRADRNCNVGNAKITNPIRITALTKSRGTGMKFVTADVNEIKAKVEKLLEQIVAKMNEMEQKFNSMNWSSSAATSMKETFSKLKTNIVESIEKIKQIFDKLVTEASEDVEAAENANTVKGGTEYLKEQATPKGRIDENGLA